MAYNLKLKSRRGPRPAIDIEPRWNFSCNSMETRLILAALGGRLTSDQIPVARALGDQLTLLRAQAAGNLADNMDIHAEKVQS